MLVICGCPGMLHVCCPLLAALLRPVVAAEPHAIIVMNAPLGISQDRHEALMSVAQLVLQIANQNHTQLPRTIVRAAMQQLSNDGKYFWGVNMLYSRKRSAEDAFLLHYYQQILGL